MITDLRPDLDKTSVDLYIKGLLVEYDKLYISLLRNESVESTAQAKMVQEIINYVRLTQVYPNQPVRGEEPPK